MDALKAARLEEITKVIHQRWGQQSLQTVKAFQARKTVKVIPTGFSDLDTALGMGGIPCGEITLVEGKGTSGMTTLCYRLIASAQQKNMVSIYLDVAQCFDADYAIRQCGIIESGLLLVYPDDLAHALSLVRDVIPLDYSGVIVLDAVMIKEPSLTASLSQSLKRLKLPLRQSRWTLLVLLSPDTCLAALSSSLHLKIKRTKWQYSDDLLSGLTAMVEVRKNIHHPGSGTAQISIEFGDDLS